MKKVLLLLGFLLLLLSVRAQQPPSLLWVKIVNDSSNCVINNMVLDANSNIYTIGTYDGLQDFDFDTGVYTYYSANRQPFIAKYDSSGRLIWAKSLNMPEPTNSYPKTLKLDGQGNLYIVGDFKSTVDFDPGPDSVKLTSSYNGDPFVLKLDTAGNFVWVKDLGDDGNATDLDFDNAGNILITSQEKNHSLFPESDIYKLDSNGDSIWVDRLKYGNVTVYTALKSQKIIVDSRGSIFVAGFFQATVDFDRGPNVVSLTSHNSLTGTSNATSFVLKLDSTGAFIKVVTLENTDFDDLINVKLDSASNLYVAGTRFQDVLPSSYQLTLFTEKLDNDLSTVWEKQVGIDGIADVILSNMVIDSLGYQYYYGMLLGRSDFDPGQNEYILGGSPNNSHNRFLLKLSPLGDFIWAGGTSGTAANVGMGLDINKAGDLYLSGGLIGTEDFDMGADSQFISSISYDIYLCKMHNTIEQVVIPTQPTSVSTLITNRGQSILAYPNPSNGLFEVSIPIIKEKITLEVYNSLGMLVYQQIISDPTTQINLGTQANGLFLLKAILNGQTIALQKIIKQ